MEPATSFPVAQDPPARPPPQTVHLGDGQRRGGWRCWVFPVILFLVVSAGFASAVYRARHSPRDIAFVLTVYWLIAVLYCCLKKMELLRADPAAAGAAVQMRRVRIGVWVVSVALASTFASRVADAMPNLALKLAAWGITAVALALVYYFIFRRRDGPCGNVAQGQAQAQSQAGAGIQPERSLQELSPEEKV